MSKNDDIEEIRAWLIDQKGGGWDAIIKRSKITRRTMTRIVNDLSYVPRISTLKLLKLAKNGLARVKK